MEHDEAGPMHSPAEARRVRQQQVQRWRERQMSTTSLSDGPKRARVRFDKSVEFLNAASEGQVEEVQRFLNQGVDPNVTVLDGLTALHQACIDGQVRVAKLLLDNGANVNARDREDWTPLHAAASVCNTTMIDLLVSRGADLLAVTLDEQTPIDVADIAEGVDKRQINRTKHCLVKHMQAAGHHLLDLAARTRARREELMRLAKLAVKDGTVNETVASEDSTLLHVAACFGADDTVNFLLEHGANPNALDGQGWTPLHAAGLWEHGMTCELLLLHGANPEIKAPEVGTPSELVGDTEFSKDFKQFLARWEAHRDELAKQAQTAAATTAAVSVANELVPAVEEHSGSSTAAGDVTTNSEGRQNTLSRVSTSSSPPQSPPPSPPRGDHGPPDQDAQAEQLVEGSSETAEKGPAEQFPPPAPTGMASKGDEQSPPPTRSSQRKARAVMEEAQGDQEGVPPVFRSFMGRSLLRRLSEESTLWTRRASSQEQLASVAEETRRRPSSGPPSISGRYSGSRESPLSSFDQSSSAAGKVAVPTNENLMKVTASQTVSISPRAARRNRIKGRRVTQAISPDLQWRMSKFQKPSVSSASGSTGDGSSTAKHSVSDSSPPFVPKTASSDTSSAGDTDDAQGVAAFVRQPSNHRMRRRYDPRQATGDSASTDGKDVAHASPHRSQSMDAGPSSKHRRGKPIPDRPISAPDENSLVSYATGSIAASEISAHDRQLPDTEVGAKPTGAALDVAALEDALSGEGLASPTPPTSGAENDQSDSSSTNNVKTSHILAKCKVASEEFLSTMRLAAEALSTDVHSERQLQEELRASLEKQVELQRRLDEALHELDTARAQNKSLLALLRWRRAARRSAAPEDDRLPSDSKATPSHTAGDISSKEAASNVKSTAETSSERQTSASSDSDAECIASTSSLLRNIMPTTIKEDAASGGDEDKAAEDEIVVIPPTRKSAQSTRSSAGQMRVAPARSSTTTGSEVSTPQSSKASDARQSTSTPSASRLSRLGNKLTKLGGRRAAKKSISGERSRADTKGAAKRSKAQPAELDRVSSGDTQEKQPSSASPDINTWL